MLPKKNFIIHNARQGKEKVEDIKSYLIPTTVSNIESHFKNLKNCEEFDMFKLLDTGNWNYGQNNKWLTKLVHIYVISEQFNSVLKSSQIFNTKEVKKEWKKVMYWFYFVFLFCIVCIKFDQSYYCINDKDWFNLIHLISLWKVSYYLS